MKKNFVLLILFAGAIGMTASLANQQKVPTKQEAKPVDPVTGEPIVATFSIVGFDPETGDLGIAVQSMFLAVGSVVPYAKAGVGAVATQASANPAYGPDGLYLLEKGRSAEETVKLLTAADRGSASRQVGVVDAQGRAFSFTGERCQDWAGGRVGVNYAAQGNILAGPDVAEAMGDAFEEARKVEGSQLADWLMAALHAGHAKGGDRRPGNESAALMVVRENGGYGGNDRYIDLRIDDSEDPGPELQALLDKKLRRNRGPRRNPNPRRTPPPSGSKN